MKIACIQLSVVLGNPEKNMENVQKQISALAQQKVDVIVLPEMWNTGYALKDLEHLADENGKKTKNLMSTLAKKYSVNIVAGSVSVIENNKFYNTMYVFNRNGDIVGEYKKAHLFQLMDEHLYLASGDELGLFEIDGIPCGGNICYDIRFPEWFRAHIFKGAQMMFVVAQWPVQRVAHWRTLLQARAIENQCFVIACNRIGSDPNNTFSGNSIIINPWGEVIAEGNELDTVITTTIDPSDVNKVRGKIPIFQDCRHELYEFSKNKLTI